MRSDRGLRSLLLRAASYFSPSNQVLRSILVVTHYSSAEPGDDPSMTCERPEPLVLRSALGKPAKEDKIDDAGIRLHD